MSRIIKLESENILPLKAIRIVPDGSMVKITGPNDSGKTTILRSIWMALGGKKELPADAIRDGADKGYVQIDVGEAGDPGAIEFTARLNLRRRENGTIADSITLKDGKGRTVSSPMAMLADMLGFGRGQFDPLAFRDAKPDKQVEMLQTALGLDFSELDTEYDEQYQQRTDVNRDAKSLAAQIGNDDPDAPDAEVSVSELVAQHDEAQILLRQNIARDAQIEDQKQLIFETQESTVRMHKEWENMKAAGKLAVELLVKLESKPPAEVPSIDEIAQQIDNAETNNARARDKIKRKELIGELRDLKARGETITESLATIKATRDKMIADADFPIPGVVIQDNQILINDHPLANQGGAAQLRFGALLVMKSDPKLRIITMDEALGKLDDESLEMLGVLLAEHDFQGWITGPRAVGEGCIEIRDGEVVDSTE